MKLLNLFLLQAVKDQADEIRFEPFEDMFRVRYSVDGTLYEMMPPPKHLASAIIHHIKTMADVDTSFKPQPQFGVIQLNIYGSRVDLLGHLFHTTTGETVSLKIIDHSCFHEYDMVVGAEHEKALMERAMQRRGLILIAGPPRSGRTVTLLSLLTTKNTPATRVAMCTEGATYYSGILHVPVDPYEPDEPLPRVVASMAKNHEFVGVDHPLVEDHLAELVEIASRGELLTVTCGGLGVVSTIWRFLAAGVEPNLLAETLQCVIGSRLLPRLCKACREPDDASEESLEHLGLARGESDQFNRRRVVGDNCDNCNNTGARYRIGCSQVLLVDENVRDVIRKAGADLPQAAQEAGLRPLLEAGLAFARQGIVSLTDLEPLVM